jgi:hypothetical protein
VNIGSGGPPSVGLKTSFSACSHSAVEVAVDDVGDHAHEEARARHEEALALYRKAGQEHSEALYLDRLKSLR